MMVHNAFYKSTDDSFGRIIAYKEGKYISRVSVYSNKNKVLSLPKQKWSNVINLPPGRWLTTHPGEWCHTGDKVLVFAAGRWGTQQWL